MCFLVFLFSGFPPPFPFSLFSPLLDAKKRDNFVSQPLRPLPPFYRRFRRLHHPLRPVKTPCRPPSPPSRIASVRMIQRTMWILSAVPVPLHHLTPPARAPPPISRPQRAPARPPPPLPLPLPPRKSSCQESPSRRRSTTFPSTASFLWRYPWVTPPAGAS